MRLRIWFLALSACGRADVTEVTASATAAPPAALDRTITSVAGYGRHDGPIADAWIGAPQDLDVLSDGSLIFFDGGFNAIRRIDAAGQVTTLVGTWRLGYGGDGGPATAATISGGYGGELTVAAGGLVYLSDFASQRIRAYNPTAGALVACGNIPVAAGSIETIAGDGELGYDGDDQPALTAAMEFPRGIAVWQGDVVFSDIDNGRVRRIRCGDGVIETVAGNGTYGVPDGTGVIHVFGPDGEEAPRTDYGDGGPATAAIVDSPAALGVGPDGALYIGEWGFSDAIGGFGRVRRVDVDGTITTVAGSDGRSGGDSDTSALDAGFGTNIKALVWDDRGRLFVAEPDNGDVRRIDADYGAVVTVMGGIYGYSADDVGRVAIHSHLVAPVGLAFKDGALYIADTGSGWIRFLHGGQDGIGPDSLVGDVGSRGGGKLPYAMGIDHEGQILIAPNGEGRLLLVDRATGAFSSLVNGDDVLPDTGGPGGPTAIAAHVGASNGIAADEDNNLYFTDAIFERLMRVDAKHGQARPSSRLHQVADFGPIAGGEFFVTDHLAVGDGVAYVSEPVHGHVYAVQLATGAITVLAGSGAQDGAGVGGPALGAGLNGPEGVALDARRHKLYVADGPQHRVWIIDLRGGATGAIDLGGAFPDCPGCSEPRQVVLLAGYLFIGDNRFYSVTRIDLDDPTLTQRFVVGPGNFPSGFVADEVPGTQAQVEPSALAAGPDGHLYIAEDYPGRVRRLGGSDLLPGTFPNVLHRHSAKGVAVALLSSYDFDAATVRPGSVTVAGAHALAGSATLCDVDGDGRLDLVVKVRPRDMALPAHVKEVPVEADVQGGRHIVDADFVQVED